MFNNDKPKQSPGKELIRKMLEVVTPAAFNLEGLGSPADKLAARYNLPNPEYLANIMGAIQAYKMLYQDGSEMNHEQRSKLSKIRARLVLIKKACIEIDALQPAGGLGGALVALDHDHNMYHVLQLHTSVNAFAITGIGPVVDPRDAVLKAFVLTLGEYWFDCTSTIPEGRFGQQGSPHAPVPGTPAAFVVEALAEAGWFFPEERVATAFAAMQRNLVGRFAGDVDDRHDGETPKEQLH